MTTYQANIPVEKTSPPITVWGFLKFAALAIVIPSGALFAAAGTINWPMGWAWVAVMVITGVGSRLILLKINPDLLRERGQYDRGAGVKDWDRKLVPFAGMIMPLASWVTAGLDYRFGWSTLPGWLPLPALLVMTLGFLFGTWAMLVNGFFSGYVRLQWDRGHEVVSSGPYRYIRHPGYAGAVLGYLMAPLVLGSWWGLIPALLASVLFAVRTSLEDRMLRAELPGYAEYAQQVRFRLIPGLW